MNQLSAVPAHDDHRDLTAAAALLAPAQRAERIPAVREAARRGALELVGLGADLANAQGPELRKRLRLVTDDTVKRVNALNAWEAALVTAQDLGD